MMSDMPWRPRLILVLLVCGFSLSAQSWDALNVLKPGDRITVLDTSDKEHKGDFTGVTTDAVSLKTGKGEVAVERARVRRVQVRSNSKRTRNALIGLAIGVTVGVVADQTAGAYFRNESGESAGARALTYIAPIALFGGLGALPAYRTVYRVR